MMNIPIATIFVNIPSNWSPASAATGRGRVKTAPAVRHRQLKRFRRDVLGVRLWLCNISPVRPRPQEEDRRRRCRSAGRRTLKPPRCLRSALLDDLFLILRDERQDQQHQVQ